MRAEELYSLLLKTLRVKMSWKKKRSALFGAESSTMLKAFQTRTTVMMDSVEDRPRKRLHSSEWNPLRGPRLEKRGWHRMFGYADWQRSQDFISMVEKRFRFPRLVAVIFPPETGDPRKLVKMTLSKRRLQTLYTVPWLQGTRRLPYGSWVRLLSELIRVLQGSAG